MTGNASANCAPNNLWYTLSAVEQSVTSFFVDRISVDDSETTRWNDLPSVIPSSVFDECSFGLANVRYRSAIADLLTIQTLENTTSVRVPCCNHSRLMRTCGAPRLSSQSNCGEG